jgi:UDP-N-acetylglucosamine acyltransferase
MSGIKVHPSAIVDPHAELGNNVEIGPFSIIERNVKLGDGTIVGMHCLITGHTSIGKKNQFFSGAIIGSDPQDLKFRGETTYTEIGDENIFREYVTVNSGTGEGTKTIIGNHNLIMTQCHIAHNCILGDHVKLANVATLAGHVQIQDYATVGGLTPIHQYVRLGSYSMVGGGFRVTQDIAPYVLTGGEPLANYGLNQVGLARAGFTKETIQLLKKAYRIIFRSKLSLQEAVLSVQQNLEQTTEIKNLIDFLTTSTRGFIR